MKNELSQAFSIKPELYKEGTHQMWTDPYIHQFLLSAHLDPLTDLASRKTVNINKTIDWIFHEYSGESLKILDLGCGPGLYTEKFASLGHQVTGIDFSNKSLEYARKSAIKNNLTISYIEADYCIYDFETGYDVIDLIFCDFGVLTRDMQKILLKKCYNALNKNGVLIIDAYNLRIIENREIETQSTVVEDSGFWRDHPYTCISNSFHYPVEQAFLDQYVILDTETAIYRFYNHYYSVEQMSSLLKKSGFSNVEPATDIIDDTTVTFYKAKK